MTHPNYLQVPSIASPFKVGDIVTYENSYGVVFTGNKVIGFSEPDEYGNYIHLGTDSHWVAHKNSDLKIESKPVYSFYDTLNSFHDTLQVALMAGASEVNLDSFTEALNGSDVLNTFVKYINDAAKNHTVVEGEVEITSISLPKQYYSGRYNGYQCVFFKAEENGTIYIFKAGEAWFPREI